MISRDDYINFSTPMQMGAYRLLIDVRDDHKHAGTVNIPFLVDNLIGG